MRRGEGALLLLRQRNWQRQFRGAMHVRDFGAVGDGLTDDTQVFKSALMATGWPAKPALLEMDPLAYRLTDTWRFDGQGLTSTPNIVIRGNGARLVSTTPGITLLEFTNSIVSLTRISVHNLLLLPNASGTRCAHLHNAELCEFLGCIFAGNGALGLEFSGSSSYNRVISSEFSNMSRGILISGQALGAQIVGCSFNEQLGGNPLNWIEVASQTDGLQVCDCWFWGQNATLPVVRLANSRSGLISGCVFRVCSEVAVQVGVNGTGDPNSIVGCSFSACQKGAIHLNGSSRCVVNGNQFGSVSLAGSRLYDAVQIERKFSAATSGSGNAIVGNTLTDTAARFMVNETGGASGNLVIGNTAAPGVGFNLSMVSQTTGNLTI